MEADIAWRGKQIDIEMNSHEIEMTCNRTKGRMKSLSVDMVQDSYVE